MKKAGTAPALATRRAAPRRDLSSGKRLQAIMRQLDAWVAQRGNGKYESTTFQPMKGYMIPDDAGIQQDRGEIEAFVERLLSRGRLSSVLEVGLGYYGSTHFLWRQLFDRVMTIEKSHERIRAFGTSMRSFHGRWVLDDGKSAFIIGMSNETGTVVKTYQCAADGIDLLFIDGDHQYGSVLTDWLLYSPLVKPGGIVAFHDAVMNVDGYYGVPEFLDRLSRGAIDGRPRTLERIVQTPNMGIAFYEQP